METSDNKYIYSSKIYKRRLLKSLFSVAGKEKSAGGGTAEGDPLIALTDISRQSPFSKSYLAMAAREGKLQARKINEVWCTTREWLGEFEKEMKDKKEEYRNTLSKNLESFGREKNKKKSEKASGLKNAARNLLLFFLRSGFVFATVVLALIVFKYVDQNYSNSNPVRSLNVKSGTVLGEETPIADQEIFSSEHFRLAQVTFGGDLAASPEETQTLEVSDVKSELVTSKSKKETQLLISWKTNKQAVGGVEYGKSGGAFEKIKKEDRYSYSHSVMLTALDPATAYGFVVTSRDKWDNEKKSDKFAFYTGAPDVSLIDLLTGAARETFGWAIGR